MQRWAGRTAIVTGAGGGVGSAVVRALVPWGIQVIGLDCCHERLHALECYMRGNAAPMYGIKCDLTKEREILQAYQWTVQNVGPVEILVNSAAVLLQSTPSRGYTIDWKKTLDTNVIAASICSREAIKSMWSCGIDEGHIININSIAGHKAITGAGLSLYSASKQALKSLTESLRMDLARMHSMIRVTSLSPGLVQTPMATEWKKELPKGSPYLVPDDIASAIIYILASPNHVNVTELIVQPTGEMM